VKYEQSIIKSYDPIKDVITLNDGNDCLLRRRDIIHYLNHAKCSDKHTGELFKILLENEKNDELLFKYEEEFLLRI
jgi:hypothetical protein